jgi:hypothetical protein
MPKNLQLAERVIEEESRAKLLEPLPACHRPEICADWRMDSAHLVHPY